MGTIPASHIVRVIPNVLAAGGAALDIIGLMLTNGNRVPIGTVQPFASAKDVGSYFGLSSTEKSLADIYFLGFDNSNIKPSRLLFAQYNEAAVAPFLRGGTLGLTLAQLTALPVGSITVTFDGVNETAASVDLSAATSFTNAAQIIQTSFTAPTFTVSYDSTAGAFRFLGGTTGAAGTVTYAGDNSFTQALKLTQATGAVISQGADAADPATFLDGITAQTTDWATFMTTFDPDSSGNTNKYALAGWANEQNNRYCYVCWDADDAPPTTVPATGSLGQLLIAGEYSGTCLIGSDGVNSVGAEQAAFICGAAASIDFTERNGRITFKFKHQSGMAASCTNESAADNLNANGYNYYGIWSTANDQFNGFSEGIVSGLFQWLDSYINQIWLNNQLQLALMVLLFQRKSIPYNAAGYTMIEAACMDVIQQGLNFGAFRAGVTLSQAQVASVNADAGLKIDETLSERGWYLQVLDADPQVRQARGSPPCTFWYMDGQSVHKINLTSVNVQ